MPPSLPQKLSLIDNNLQIKVSFLKGVSLGKQTTFKGRPHAQMANTNKLNGIFGGSLSQMSCQAFFPFFINFIYHASDFVFLWDS